MLLQNTQADCGPAALHNALEVLGQRRSMDELRDLCRMTAQDGVDERKMIRAVGLLKESCGLEPWLIKENRRLPALGQLLLAFRRGRPIICGVDQDEHWVTLLTDAGERFLVADSDNASMVLSYDGDDWFARWDSGNPRSRYWGLVL